MALEKRNVFVLALDEFHRRELDTVQCVDDCVYHGLLDPEEVLYQENISVKSLLTKARLELDAFPGTVDAILTHWDFPLSVIAPILCAERGLRSPSLESVLRCSDKYWSRLEQSRAIPKLTPAFVTVDPFEVDGIDQVGLDPPFWIKPVASYASQLGFRVETQDDLDRALAEIRAGIDRIGDPFEDVLEAADIPEEVSEVGGTSCIAEEYLIGRELAHEGAVFDGETLIHGTVDMVRDREIFTRYELPSTAPTDVLERMEEGTRRLIEAIGFDQGCFNAEYFWDPRTDRLTLVEVNPRASQSHSYLFDQVAGRSNHQVMVDVALGHKPRLPDGGGPYARAAKCLHSVRDDGIVTKVPGEEELERAREIFPDVHVELIAAEGERLSELADQDAYSYKLAEVSVAGADQEELLERYRAIVDALDFRIKPV